MHRSRLFLRCSAVLAAALCTSIAFAQSAVIPIPAAVVKDSDGNVVGQIVQADPPMVLVRVDGIPTLFRVSPEGRMSSSYISFDADQCNGNAYMGRFSQLGGFLETSIAVMGPNPDTGSYRVFKRTGTTEACFWEESYYNPQDNECVEVSSNWACYFVAVERKPNPLEGLQGPTTEHPERVWSIEGGTTYIPAAP